MKNCYKILKKLIRKKNDAKTQKHLFSRARHKNIRVNTCKSRTARYALPNVTVPPNTQQQKLTQHPRMIAPQCCFCLGMCMKNITRKKKHQIEPGWEGPSCNLR